KKKELNSRHRKSGKTVGEYVAELRKLLQDCNYGETLMLVCGINDDRIQRRLLSETDLTIDSASKNIKDLLVQSTGAPSATCNAQGSQVKVNKVFRSGGKHSPQECRFKNEKCHNCGVKGHIKKACRNKNKERGDCHNPKDFKSPHGTHHLKEEEDKEDAEEHEAYTMCSMKKSDIPKVAPITVILNVKNKNVQFKLDTACIVTIMNQREYSDLWNSMEVPELETCDISLKTYTGEKVNILGATQITVMYQGKAKELPLVVVTGSGPNLLGRDWGPVYQVTQSSHKTLQDVIAKHEMVFKEELGTLQGTTVKIYIERNATPHYFKPRSVPYATKPKAEAELDCLLKEKMMEPVKFSDWAAPIVPVVKSDDSVRICGDYKLTVNRMSCLKQYPSPKIDDLFAILSGGEQFTKLDMSCAYQQIVVEEDSKKYVTVNTHNGLFRDNRLPLGVSSAPGIFQRTMEGLLQGILQVAVYLDDILVTGLTEVEHLENLEEILNRLEKAGLCLKRSKCTFKAKEVVFLGHKVDATGLHPVKEEVQAIQEAPATKLKSYLGLLNDYNRFLPNLSALLMPLQLPLQKYVKWYWGCVQEKAFEASKK
uniref:ribonuclease H n=1 Tax=Latimeria chalumnae TaxID=7897 RepID=H3B9C2_LATCH